MPNRFLSAKLHMLHSSTAVCCPVALGMGMAKCFLATIITFCRLPSLLCPDPSEVGMLNCFLSACHFLLLPSLCCPVPSPPDHLLVVGMLELANSFYSVLVSVSIFMVLSTVFHSIKCSRQLSAFSVFFRSYSCLIGPFNYIYISLYESLPQS